ncbi:molybdopterin-containing oxidoreductase family protein [Mycolicibacterium vinylchloridicum]|uniref:molybdopterin-containing oxidoreductase family protein n=1 Tax=Mycolicibacterium vinylchloridicum TaxID=2736928 RepID=UPI0015C7F7A8|nr:molybdopterin-dependent oxidoreductase [Mycolicibacterium vinylchloridicum]
MVEQHTTYCRICEPLCGMVATVDDGRLVALRPDKEHPLSSGFACQKGIAFTEVQNDPDRVTTPLRRTAAGFEPVSWDEAMSDIADRLGAILRAHGPGAIGCYMGNPAAFSYAHLMWLTMFVKGLGGRRGAKCHNFSASTQDTSSRLLASQFLYGTPTSVPIPDLQRIELLVIVGANPVVSHGSFLTAPRIHDRLRDIVKDGGRVVVVDPRRTETATQFEWLGIRPGSDPYFLLSLLHVLFEDGLVDRGRADRQADGLDWLRGLAQPWSPEHTVARTGIEPDAVRALAHELSGARRAALYGRLGTCVGEFGTLTSYLLDAVNLAAGNLDVPGGSVFSGLQIPGMKWTNTVLGSRLRSAYRKKRTRVGSFPLVTGYEPAALMAKEITTPGNGQIKALLVSAGNPVLTVPNGNELASAIAELELSVALDLYVTETTGLCDYILPVTTMYERDDFALTFQGFQATAFRQTTEAVVPPRGDARGEWEIFDDLMQRLARHTPMFAVLAVIRRALRLGGKRMNPRVLADAIVRLSEGGDRFGLKKSGLTFGRLTKEHPHGKVLSDYLPTGVLPSMVAYRSRRMKLEHDEIRGEVDKLSRDDSPDDYPMQLIGMREPKSENSWMHNTSSLMRGERRHRALMHELDADPLGIRDGDRITVASRTGEIEVDVEITKDIVVGVIAIPHGWGHNGSGTWQLANRARGANVNELMSSDVADVESLSGMSRLTGIPVRVARAQLNSESR